VAGSRLSKLNHGFSLSYTFSKYLNALFDTFDSTINNMQSKKNYLVILDKKKCCKKLFYILLKHAVGSVAK